MSEQQNIEAQKWINEVSVEVTDKVCNYSETLRGVKNIAGYMRAEVDAWERTRTQASQRNLPLSPFLNSVISYFTDCANELHALLKNAESHTRDQFDAQWNSIKTRIERPSQRLVFSKSTLGLFFLKLYGQDTSRADGAFKYFNKQHIDPHNSAELSGFLDGYAFENPVEGSAKERVDLELQALQQARNDWEQKAHDIQISFDGQKTELSEWKANFVTEQSTWVENAKKKYDDFRIEKGLELTKLEETYKEKLKLEAPVDYWNSRAESYRLRGRSWLIGLGCVIAVLEAFLALTLYDLPEAFHHRLFSGEPEAIKGVIVFVTILSFGAYLARVFARLTFSSFHIERDAEERAQLTLVYLALMKEKAVTEKEREIILQSLFSRVETGLLSGDSSPTMPSLSSAIDLIGKPKQ